MSLSATDIRPLEQSFRRVLMGQRICQLYCFMLIFEPLSKLVTFGIEWVIWAIGAAIAIAMSDSVQTIPAFGELFEIRSLRDLIFVANVWAVFAIYSAFRPAWWSIILCLIALGYNQFTAWFALQNDPTDWVALMGDQSSGEAFLRSVAWRDFLFMGGLAVLHLYFIAIAFLGQREIHSRSAEERSALSEYGVGQATIGNSLLALFGIPQAIRYAWSKLLTGLLMIFVGVANFTNFWRLTFVFLMVSFAPMLMSYTLLTIDADGASETAETAVIVATIVVMVIFLGFLLLIPWVIKLLGRLAMRLSRAQMRVSLESIQHRDSRAPVLFLRSFADDLVALPNEKRSLIGWLLDSARKGMTLDYMMLEEGTRIGPCVALGNPDDPAPPYGVARGYFDHDDWQDAVRSLCRDSAAIVLVLDQTEGVDWEISHIARGEFSEKTLFLLAPGDVGQERGQAMLDKAISSITRSSKAQTAALNSDPAADGSQTMNLGFVVEDGSVRLLTCQDPTQYTYLVTIRHFLRSLADGSDKLPNTP